MTQRTTTPSVTKRLSNTQNEPRVPHRMLLLQPISFDINTFDKKKKTGNVATGLRTNATKNIWNYKRKCKKITRRGAS